ncbi:MAG: polysaccharide deacetylase family protein [bacterium]
MTRWPTILWRISDDRVYLTFDDGPDRDMTPKLLSLLDNHSIQATFFLIGSKAERFPKIVRQIYENGHTIGNHTYTHAPLIFKSREKILTEIRSTENIVHRITGCRPRLFRPPHGRFGMGLLAALRDTEYKIVLWNASSQDYKVDATPERIQRRLYQTIKPGKTVLLHDGHKKSPCMLAALTEILNELSKNNLRFSAIPT